MKVRWRRGGRPRILDVKRLVKMASRMLDGLRRT